MLSAIGKLIVLLTLPSPLRGEGRIGALGDCTGDGWITLRRSGDGAVLDRFHHRDVFGRERVMAPRYSADAPAAPRSLLAPPPASFRSS